MIYLVTNNRELFTNNIYKTISVEESFEILNPMKVVGLDTETKGLDFNTDKLLLVQLGNKLHQVVIDCSTLDIRLYKEYLQSDRLFLGWNIKFDLTFLLKQGIVVNNVWDGMISEQLLYIGSPKGSHRYSLQAAVKQYIGAYMDKSVRGQIIYSDLNTDIIEYAANDVYYLEDIVNKQNKLLKSKGLDTAIVYEQKSIPWLSYTEFCGIKLDVDKWSYKMKLDDQVKDILLKSLNNWVLNSYYGKEDTVSYIQTEGLDDKSLKKARKKINGVRYKEGDIKGDVRGYFEAYKIPITHKVSKEFIHIDIYGDLWEGYKDPECNINWNSSDQVIGLLNSFGLNIKAKDKDSGEMKDTVEAKVLKPLSDKCSLIPIYLAYKEAYKVCSTYGQNVLNQINPSTKRIHTNFNLLGTNTCRLSSGGEDKKLGIKKINMQNIPSDAETRACFVSEEGYDWISCDYSGQESRIIAELSQDKAMLDLFNNGCGDVHSLVAYMSFPDKIPRDTRIEDIKESYHKERGDAKGVEFAINYGGNDSTISSNSGRSPKESKVIYDNYMEGFPGIKSYQDGQRYFVNNNGYIVCNPTTQMKFFFSDYELLNELKDKFTPDFWDTYRRHRKTNASLPMKELRKVSEHFVKVGNYNTYMFTKGTQKLPDITEAQYYQFPVKFYYKAKSSMEKNAINYPCQYTGAAMFKTAMIFFFDYLIENNLVFKVKMVAPVHDEMNVESPEEYTETVTAKLKECMSKSGAFFCKSLELPADAEVHKFWVH